MELFQLNSIFIILGIILIILVLLGKIAPKFAGSLIVILTLLHFIPNLFFKGSNEQVLNAFQIPKDTLETVNQLPLKDEPSEKRSVSKARKEETTPTAPKNSKKYLTKVKVIGITDNEFIKAFENLSGYNHSKKGDYLIEFSYTGSIKPNAGDEENRFVFSGGNLIVHVDEEKCCCGGIVPIPANIPLGKTMKEANQIMSQKIVEYARLNSTKIIPMIAECLPNH